MKFEKGDRVKLNCDTINSKFHCKQTGKQPYAPNGILKRGMVYFVEEVYHRNGVPYGISILGYPIYVDGDSEDIIIYDIKLFENLSILKRLQ